MNEPLLTLYDGKSSIENNVVLVIKQNFY